MNFNGEVTFGDELTKKEEIKKEDDIKIKISQEYCGYEDQQVQPKHHYQKARC